VPAPEARHRGPDSHEAAAVHLLDEVLDVVVGRPEDDVLARALLDDLAVAQDGDPVAEPERLIEVVGDEDDRLADLLLEVTFRLEKAEPEGNLLKAVIGSDYGGVRQERLFDQIVVNHGTLPLDELYFDLQPLSRNLGEVSYDDLIDGRPQTLDRNPEGAFQLFRIGDAVSARNTHAAIYDALRLMKDL